MSQSVFVGNRPVLAALFGVSLLVAGCQSGGPLGGLGAGAGTQAGREDLVPEEELRAFCPQAMLREGTAYYNTFERGGDGDRTRMVYQASIEDITRACNYNGSTVTMNVAVAGRIVPGPRGSAGAITMPIRVAVVRGREVLYSELHQHQVQVSDTAGATQFIFNDPGVTFQIPSDHAVRVFVGYDEGPGG